jgi:hypothetical protein
LPIDILGGGYTVAPPSRGRKSPYEIISGSLDDLDRLPRLQNFSAPKNGDAVGAGRRNESLWQYCMKNARACDDFNALLDVAETFNEQTLVPPLGADEVVKTARSAWCITERGENRFIHHAAVVPVAEADRFITSMVNLGFLTWLKAHNRPDGTFMIADGLAPTIGLSRDLLRACRRQLVEMGIVHRVSAPRPGVAAFYRWGNGLSKPVGLSLSNGIQGRGGSVSEDRGRNPVGLVGGGAA